MKYVVRATLCCLLLLIILSSLKLSHFFYNKNYDAFIAWIVTALQKESNWVPFFKSRLTTESFRFIKYLIVVFDAVLLLAIGWGLYRYKTVEAIATECFTYCWTVIKKAGQWLGDLPVYQRYSLYAITLFSFGKSLWYDALLPVQYDEAWTYNYFISNDLWQSFLLPSNNHKLYTFIAWWFNLLPFDKLFLIRLPNALAGTILLVLFFYFVKKFFRPGTAIGGLAWFATCGPVAMYMILARSYIYVLVFTLLLLVLYAEWWKHPKKKVIFVPAFLTVLSGYFSNPVFFFGHFILTLYTFSLLLKQRQFNNAKYLFITNLAAVPFIILLSVSDIFGGHVGGLLGVAYKESRQQNYFWENMTMNAGFLTGFESGYIIVVTVLLALLVLSFTRDPESKKLLVYAVVSIAWLPVYATVVHDDTAAHKVIYITISFGIILMSIFQSGCNRLLRNKYFILFVSLTLLTANTICLKRYGWLNWSFGIDNSVKQVSKVLLQNNATECYIEPYYYKPGIQFYHKIDAKPIRLYMAEAHSIDFDSTIFTKKYPEFVLMDLVQQIAVNKEMYHLVFKDEIVALYKINTAGTRAVDP